MPPQYSSRLRRPSPKNPNEIRHYRLKSGYTQRQVGCLVGVRPSTVSAWERGMSCPSARVLLRLAKELDTLAEGLYPHFYNDRRREPREVPAA